MVRVAKKAQNDFVPFCVSTCAFYVLLLEGGALGVGCFWQLNGPVSSLV